MSKTSTCRHPVIDQTTITGWQIVLDLFRQFFVEIFVENREKLFGAQIMRCLQVFAVDTEGKVLGHLSALNRLNTNHFQGITKGDELGVIVEFPPKGQSSGPGENGSDGIS
jgi:hypothetical protein